MYEIIAAILLVGGVSSLIGHSVGYSKGIKVGSVRTSRKIVDGVKDEDNG